MVSLAVFSDKSGPVDGKDDVQMQKRHVVQQHVIRALQKSGIDRDNGYQALFGKAGRHGYGVLFCNADVKKPLGKHLCKAAEAGPMLHRGRDGAYACVLLGALLKRPAKLAGKTPRPACVQKARLRVKAAHTVKILRRALSRRIALALFCDEVHEHRLTQADSRSERGNNIVCIVPVDGAKVGKAQIFKDGRADQAAAKSCLELVREGVQGLSAGDFGCEIAVAELKIDVARTQPRLGKIA